MALQEKTSQLGKMKNIERPSEDFKQSCYLLESQNPKIPPMDSTALSLCLLLFLFWLRIHTSPQSSSLPCKKYRFLEELSQ